MRNYIEVIGMTKRYVANSEFVYTLLSRVIQMLGSIVLLKVITAILPSIEYANYSLILSISSLIVALPFTAIDQGVLRYVADYRKNNFKLFFTTIILFILFFSFIYFVLIAATYFFIPLPDFWPSSLSHIWLFVLGEALRIILFSFELAERKRKTYFYISLAEFVFKLGFIAFISYLPIVRDSLNVFNCYILSNYLVVIYLIVSRRKELGWKKEDFAESKKIMSIIWQYSSPFMILSIFAWFQSLGMRWILNFLSNKVAVANYSALSAIATLPGNAIVGLLSAFTLPILFEIELSRPGVSRQKIWQFLTPLVILLTIIIIFFAIFHEQIVMLAFGKEYLPYSYGLWVLSIGGALNSIAGYLSFEFMVLKKAKFLLYSNIIPGILNLTLGSLLVYKFGFDGAIWSYAIINAVFVMLVVYKQKSISEPNK